MKLLGVKEQSKREGKKHMFHRWWKGKENNCKLSIKQRTPAQPWSPFNPEAQSLERSCTHNFSACVTPQELKQTRWETRTERGGGSRTQGFAGQRRMPERGRWCWKTAEEVSSRSPLWPLPGSRSMTFPIWSQSLNSWQLPETPQPISCTQAPPQPCLPHI